MLIVDANELAIRLPYERLVPALARALASTIAAPPRAHHALPHDASLLLMPAWDDEHIGLKQVNVFPANGERGLRSISSAYLLSDARTGRIEALLDGEVLTARRTAAMAALAASFLAPADANHLLLVGAGCIARQLPRAFASVRPIDRVTIWNRNRQGAEAAAREISEQGFATTLCSDLAEGVEHASIIACATLSNTPLILGETLASNSHVSLIGGFRPHMREADSEAIGRCFVVADTRAGAIAEAGDLIAPLTEGRITLADIHDLADLCRGDVIAPIEANRTTLFKSVGHASQDLAAAKLCLRASDLPL